MQIVLHTGAYFTQSQFLFETLWRNKSAFEARGGCIPPQAAYGGILQWIVKGLGRSEPNGETGDALINAITGDDEPERLILSQEPYFGMLRYCFAQGRFYPMAPQRMVHSHRMFANDQIEHFMAIRNPAAFLPLLLAARPDAESKTFGGDLDLRHVRWSDTITQIHEAVPNVKITLWCYEDLPYIWAKVIREMLGFDATTPIEGEFDLLAQIMTEDGLKRMQTYFATHPELNTTQQHRAISAFLSKFALADAMEEKLELSGWSAELIEEMSEIYDADLELCAQVPNVHLIEP